MGCEKVLSAATQKRIKKHHTNHHRKRRTPYSVRYPWLAPYIVGLRQYVVGLRRTLSGCYIRNTITTDLAYRLAKHQSVLRRRLGDSQPRLQEQKIKNLAIAATALNNICIQPGKYFSLSHILGKPTYKKGYVDGMLLSNGKVIEGVGGGLCQLSNLLCWLMSHSDMRLVERYHHSRDVFPDSGRVLPFGSGATFVYQLRDLVFQNITGHPIQLKLWMTEKHLKGELRSTHKPPYKYSLGQENHCFVCDEQGDRYRYNQIYRYRMREGTQIAQELLFENFAPVLYEVDRHKLQENEIFIMDMKTGT